MLPLASRGEPLGRRGCCLCVRDRCHANSRFRLHPCERSVADGMCMYGRAAGPRLHAVGELSCWQT